MKRSEEGFTVIELLVSIAITGIVFGVVNGAVILALRTTDVTTARAGESVDAQRMATYFSRDVQSATTVSIPGDFTGCNVTPAPTSIIRFSWGNPVAPSTTNAPPSTTPIPQISQIAIYGIRTGETELTRWYCDGSATPTLVTAIASHLKVGVGGPSATCTPSCAARPNRVAMTLTEVDSTTTFIYTVDGRTRVSPTTTTT